MRRWRSLKAIINDPAFGEITKRKVDYIPDRGRFSTSKVIKGRAQCFEDSPDLDWYPILYNGELYLVSDGHYDQLVLFSTIGTTKQRKCLEGYGRALCSNRKLGAKGIALTTDMFRHLPKHLKDKDQYHYLASKREHKGKIVCAAGATKLISNKKEFYEKMGIRPVVKLPDDIMVCLDKPNENLIIARRRDVKKIDEELF